MRQASGASALSIACALPSKRDRGRGESRGAQGDRSRSLLAHELALYLDFALLLRLLAPVSDHEAPVVFESRRPDVLWLLPECIAFWAENRVAREMNQLHAEQPILPASGTRDTLIAHGITGYVLKSALAATRRSGILRAPPSTRIRRRRGFPSPER